MPHHYPPTADERAKRILYDIGFAAPEVRNARLEEMIAKAIREAEWEERRHISTKLKPMVESLEGGNRP